MNHYKYILNAAALLFCSVIGLLTSVPIQAQEVRSYFITDAVGSPVMATDAYANVTWSEDYLPYGERRYRSAGSGANGRWYTSAPQNEDTGLVDLGKRQYDPVIGRFLGVDPVGISAAQPFSVNRYAYANNNPYRYVDPDGGNPIVVAMAINAGVGAVIGGGSAAAVNALIQYNDTGTVRWSGSGGVIDAAGDGAFAGLMLGMVGAGEVGGVAGAASAVRNGVRNAKADGQAFERVVSNAELQATQKTGLLRGGREGENFFTNKASLDAKRAQQRLGLDDSLRDARIQFRIKSDINITGPRAAAPGESGTAGGGREFSTSGKTEIEILRVDPLRK